MLQISYLMFSSLLLAGKNSVILLYVLNADIIDVQAQTRLGQLERSQSISINQTKKEHLVNLVAGAQNSFFFLEGNISL